MTDLYLGLGLLMGFFTGIVVAYIIGCIIDEIVDMKRTKREIEKTITYTAAVPIGRDDYLRCVVVGKEIREYKIIKEEELDCPVVEDIEAGIF